MCQNQACFRHGPGRIDQISTLQQVLEERNIFPGSEVSFLI